MKIGLICDLHMPDVEKSVQGEFFMRAVEQFKSDGISTVISLGDISSFGEYEVFFEYLETMKDFDHYFVLGNSDVRDRNTAPTFEGKAKRFTINADGRTIAGINTPYGRIEENDKEILGELGNGDIVVLHHSIQGLCEESRRYITELTQGRELIIIHGHSHKKQDYILGKSRVVGVRALDPDKSIGDFPCITYFDTETNELEEKLFTVPIEAIQKISKKFGISCVDNHRDIAYATENNVYGVELRCNGKGWEPDYTLIPKIEEWRKKTGGYLSAHMPNLDFSEGEIKGIETWYKAVEFASKIGVNGLTVHPPRGKKTDMPSVREELMKLHVYAVKSMSADVKIGIENLHMHRGEGDTPDRGFGYAPSEVSGWIDDINKEIGIPDRVGHVLDVGHARNNGILSQKYPISKWYDIMGRRTVAYHIHQVIPGEDGAKNHNPIENWFGPLISYVSFFYCMDKGVLNYVPMFLEVRGAENYEKSIRAFYETFK